MDPRAPAFTPTSSWRDNATSHVRSISAPASTSYLDPSVDRISPSSYTTNRLDLNRSSYANSFGAPSRAESRNSELPESRRENTGSFLHPHWAPKASQWSNTPSVDSRDGKGISRPSSAASSISTQFGIPSQCEVLEMDDANSDLEEANHWSPHSEGLSPAWETSVPVIWEPQKDGKSIENKTIEYDFENSLEILAHRKMLDEYMPAHWDKIKRGDELRMSRSCGDLREGSMM